MKRYILKFAVKEGFSGLVSCLVAPVLVVALVISVVKEKLTFLQQEPNQNWQRKVFQSLEISELVFWIILCLVIVLISAYSLEIYVREKKRINKTKYKPLIIFARAYVASVKRGNEATTERINLQVYATYLHFYENGSLSNLVQEIRKAKIKFPWEAVVELDGGKPHVVFVKD